MYDKKKNHWLWYCFFFTGKRQLEEDYKQLLLSGRHSDVTIQVEKKEFKCHKCILAVRSPVFSAMFEHNMQENVSGLVTIKDAKPTSFQTFLHYLYTGNEEHLNWENVIDLYQLGDKYVVEKLKDLCVEYMRKNLSMDKFFDVFLLSQQYNDSILTNISKLFFLNNSNNIVCSKSWMNLLTENPNESNVLITALVDSFK